MATAEHLRDLDELVRLAESDLRVVFDRHDDPEQARDELMDTLPQLVEMYGMAAATLGADWYDDLREQAAVRGRFSAIPAELPDRGRTDALARWGAGPMFSAEPDKVTAHSKVSGGLQRIIANADRETVAQSAVQDRQAQGWRRQGTGRCDWCAERINLGIIYDNATAFGTHDFCGCIAVPAFA